MTFIDARHILVGDSAWCYWSCFDALRFDDTTVVCNPANRGMFEFFRDYLVGCEDLRITEDEPGYETRTPHGGPWNREELFYFRKPLEPIVEPGPYLCFQPESAAHNKRKRDLDELECRGRGYSVGVLDEKLMRGTQAFHGHSISDVARLIMHSAGMVGIFSSMALFASLLGKKVVVCNYDGATIGERLPTGFRHPRCMVLNASTSPDEIVEATRKHIGEGWL